MKITIKTNNKIYSAEEDLPFEGCNINDAIEMFKGLLVSAGFHPSNVDEMFNTEYQWFTEEERDANMQGHLYKKENVDKSLEDLERLSRDQKVQEFQDNMYKQDDEDIFS